jgi:formate hydrogenlyase subunit 3/multisubunit Na+/H+ antiporter MnhD subunit
VLDFSKYTHVVEIVLGRLFNGNILLSYRTRSIARVNGLFDCLPANGALWVFGMLLICGTPPSPLFFTELALVRQAGLIPGAAVLLLLLVIFCGMSERMLKMTVPGSVKQTYDPGADKLAKVPAMAITLVTLLGVAIAAVWLAGGR